jgi:hypothetical protein
MSTKTLRYRTNTLVRVDEEVGSDCRESRVRHLVRAKDLADASYFEPLRVEDLARAGAAAS